MTFLPSNIVKCLSKADKAKLGKAGLTVDEAISKAEAKSEKELQANIHQMLTRRGIYVIRSRMDKKTSNQTGCPDIIFTAEGKPYAWEVKLPKKRPTIEQEAALKQMAGNGWNCSVITSYEQALLILNELEAQ